MLKICARHRYCLACEVLPVIQLLQAWLVCCFFSEPMRKEVSLFLSSVFWKQQLCCLYGSSFSLLILPQGFMDGKVHHKAASKKLERQLCSETSSRESLLLTWEFEWQLLLVTSVWCKRELTKIPCFIPEDDSELGTVRFTSSLKLGFWAGIPKISQGDSGFLRLKRWHFWH